MLQTSKFALDNKSTNTKIIFDDDGEIERKEVVNCANIHNNKGSISQDSNAYRAQFRHESSDGSPTKAETVHKQKIWKGTNADGQQKWYNVYPQYPLDGEILDMKDTAEAELMQLCNTSFAGEASKFAKYNPSDSRWLHTALNKGTAKDRANAGALLVTSNPLGNLVALSTLIGYTKISNKSSTEVITILTDLWKEVLLPSHRKLYSIGMRLADWKSIQNDTNASKEELREIYAYWHFENAIKDQYFEFLKNIQQGIQNGQENNKLASIRTASLLLIYSPEKEQMLLSMLVNKLGDPLPKIASKSLYHLMEVVRKHPNMCSVIAIEVEKLLFRNNITEHAQHFGLCLLACVAHFGKSEVSPKLVHICFSLFKVLVEKGAVNNRMMQAILRCLQTSLVQAEPVAGQRDIMDDEMRNTMYRLVHLADIQISLQALSLLLQLVNVKTEKSERFYNALYRKMLELEITALGAKSAAQFLHIVHRAIHTDSNTKRALAFIKRLLQMALYMPAHMCAGCLIVVQKLLHNRKDLNNANGRAPKSDATIESLRVMPQSEAETKAETEADTKAETLVKEDNADANGDQSTATPSTSSIPKTNARKVYDPYHRAPMFAGAGKCARYELRLLGEFFHPSVQLFANNILNQKRITYYGDPLRDFSLAHFLERFAFKNPKKVSDNATPKDILRNYVAFGTRGRPVKLLTKEKCTEDEMFIFNYLEQKRQRQQLHASMKQQKSDDVDDDMEAAADIHADEVNDDEFEEYLDGFFGAKSKHAAMEATDGELNFLQDLNVSDAGNKKSSKEKPNDEKRMIEDVAADWGNQDEQETDEEDDEDDEIDEIDDEYSEESDTLSANEGGIDDEMNDSDNDEMDDSDNDEMNDSDNDEMDDSANNSQESDSNEDEEYVATGKKPRASATMMNERTFSKKLKHSDDMNSLFAAADDFADLLEEGAKEKGHGTISALSNKDKSSEKQLKWEEKRRSNAKTYTKRKFSTMKRRNQSYAKKQRKH